MATTMHIMLRLFMLLLALWLPVAAVDGTVPSATRSGPTVYIPVDGMIEPHLARYIERALDEAESASASTVILHIDTDGGRVDSAREILDRLLRVPADGPRLIAWIHFRAISAGALIAYGCHEVHLTSQATIGNIGVIFQKPDGTMDFASEKQETMVRALLKQAGEHRGWNRGKLLKMTARNQELYRFDVDGVTTWVIEEDLAAYLAAHPGATRPTVPDKGKDLLITYTAPEALREGMATALHTDLAAFYRDLGIDAAAVRDFSPTRTEVIARALAGFAPLLAGLAVLFLMIELKAPGVGLWISLSAVCAGLFFICQFYQELAGAPEVILAIVGVAIIALDLFWLQTGGMVALAGAALGLVGLILAFMPDASQFTPSTEGWSAALAAAVTQSLFALAMVAVGAAVIILTLPKNPLVARLALKRELAANATDPAVTHDLIGRRGVARSALRPGGTIDVDGQSLSAVAEHGEFVPAGTAVDVIAFSLGEAVVRPVTA